MTEERGAEFQELQRAFAGHAAEGERQRAESYELFEDLGEAEVDRRVHLGDWLNYPDAPLMQVWAAAWLREQETKPEARAVVAAEVTADPVASSARSAKIAARWAMWASVIALLAIVWSVWGP